MNLPVDVPGGRDPGVQPAAAVILAGGRSSRLGGVPKAALQVDDDGGTLLAVTVAAADAALEGRNRGWAGADHAGTEGALAEPPKPCIAVVGPAEELRPLLSEVDRALWVREEPPFSGPAAGLAAGLEALEAASAVADDADMLLVLACDMPGVVAAVDALLAGSRHPSLPASAPERRGGGEPDGWLAVDGDRDQPLAALYRAGPLRAAVDESRARGTLENSSVFRLVASLDLTRVHVPPGSTADVDTWADAQALGVRPGSREDQP